MDDTGEIAKPDASPRKQSRAARRQQLIEATIETIAAQGYSRTTLTDVARQAGISHGLVNFHFETKERLLTETLQYLAAEYRQNWTAALEAAGPSPAEQLDAVLRADFDPRICTNARLSAWCAFWGRLSAGRCTRRSAARTTMTIPAHWKASAPGSWPRTGGAAIRCGSRAFFGSRRRASGST